MIAKGWGDDAHVIVTVFPLSWQGTIQYLVQ